ncbi:MAG: TetR/AcrR family transcriptional regulator [Syntrophothermus sp.]
MKNNPKKTLIIKAAQKRFARHGVAKTTIEEIARDLRIGKASLYNYFKSKEEIFQEVLNSETERYLSEVKEIFTNDGTDLREKMLSYLVLKENMKERNILVYNLILGLFRDFLPEQESELLKLLLKGEEEIITKFLKLVAKKDLLPDLPSFAVNFTWGLALTNNFDLLTERYSPGKNSEILEIFLKDYLL